MNKLQCPLCHQPYNQPSMCPHCSEVYCHNCIRSYLNKYYFCPSCDQHIIELVDCSRLINEVKEKIKESDLKKSKQLLIQTIQLCKEHSLPLKYHCLTCSIDICSDCGLISQKHISHNIKPLENQPPKNIITPSQLKQIKQKVSEKLTFFQEQQKRYILELQLLKSQIKYNKAKIYQYYENLILRLEKETQIILKDIESNINECNKNISERMNIRQKLQSIEKNSLKSLDLFNKSELLSTSNKSSTEVSSIEILDRQLYQYLVDKNLINKNQLLKQESKRRSTRKNRNFLKKDNEYQLQRQEKSSQKSEKSLANLHPSLLFDKKIYELGIMYIFQQDRKQIYPEYQNFSFELDYSLLKDEDIIYSPKFKVHGYEWRLKIYPHGNAQVFGQHLSVFLELANSPQALISNTPKEYYFRLELLNLNQAGKSVIKEYNSKFSVGQCWGYAEFIQLKELKDYLHDGKLLFVMGIKNVSYFDLCENMKKYIYKLEGETKILSEICEGYYLNSNNSLQSQRSHEFGLNSSSSSDEQNFLINPPSHRSHLLTQDEISSIISSIDDD